MHSKDIGDIAAGLTLFALGLAAAIYCATHYDLGTLNYMGPGMFPTGSAAVLAFFGILITVPAFTRAAPLPSINLRPALAIIAGVAGFALTISDFGLVPATILLTAITVLADRRLGIIGTLMLAAGLSLLGWLIFIFALDIPVPAFAWPF